jgi:hypothetical protein
MEFEVTGERIRTEPSSHERVVRHSTMRAAGRLRRHLGRALVRVLAGGLLAGCGQTDAAPLVARRDSAGVRIVELDADRLPPLFAVDPGAAWVLGGEGVSDALVFHEIMDAEPLGEDVVVIAEASTQQVIRVDLASGEIRRFGGVGDGPEEFRGLTQVYDAGGGRIGAFDRVRNRYVEIDADGRFVEVVPIPSVNQLGSNYLERAGTGVLYLAAVTSFPVDSAPGARRGEGAILRLGAKVDTVTTIPGNSVFFEQDAMGGVIFGATTVVAPAPAGLWVGDTDKPQAVLWEDDSVRAIVRWTSNGSRQVTEARREEFWRRLEEGVPPDQRPLLEDARRTMHFADTIPAFGDLRTAPYGGLWIGGYVPPEPLLLQQPPPAQTWMIVDVAGESAGTATTPEGFRVLHVDDDFVLGVHMDELGVETLRRYDLQPGTGT